MKKPKHWEIVKLLHEQLRHNCKQFLVTGGVALELYGVVKPEEVHDVDLILIDPDGFALDKLKTLQQVVGIKDRPSSIVDLNKNLYRFEIRGVTVDVFIEYKEKDFAMWFDYVRVNPLLDIFDAKKKMGRKKDWEFMVNMIGLVCMPVKGDEMDMSI